MEYYSVIKRNKLELVVLRLVVLRWMSLETVTQSEVRKRKTNVIYIYIYMESRKIVLMNLFTENKWRCRGREWTCGHSWGSRS